MWEDTELRSENEPVHKGMCQPPVGCYDEIDELREKRSKSIFIIAIPLGLILIALGAFVFQLNSVGLGVMFGGIFTVTEGYVCYWSELPPWLRFLSLLVAFAVLLYIGYRKFPKKE